MAKQKSDEFNATEKLLAVWEEHLDGTTRAERCSQLSERVLGLLSLMAVSETKPVFAKLWEIINFDDLYSMIGKYGCTGIAGPNKNWEESEIF